jgi:hypothetical protein
MAMLKMAELVRTEKIRLYDECSPTAHDHGGR